MPKPNELYTPTRKVDYFIEGNKTLVSQLRLFSFDKSIASITSKLDNLTSADESAILLLREQLNQLLIKARTQHYFSCVAVLAHEILLKLAEFKPLNENCFFLSNVIPYDNKVFTSLGYQFDIHRLIDFHNNRKPREEEVIWELENLSTYHHLNRLRTFFFEDGGDDFNPFPMIQKRLLNPLTKTPFSLEDAMHILHVAQSKKCAICDLHADVGAALTARPRNNRFISSVVSDSIKPKPGIPDTKITRLRQYLSNYEKGFYPHLSLDTILATTEEQSENLKILYPLIELGITSLSDAKKLSGKNRGPILEAIDYHYKNYIPRLIPNPPSIDSSPNGEEPYRGKLAFV